jgi:glycosyltransferase involved in cell wall biosynthesis
MFGGVLRIIHIIDTLRSGGRERQLVELLKGLSKEKKISCHVIVMSHDIHYTYLNDFGVTIHKLIRTSQHDVSIFYHLYRLLSKIKPDILHSWGSMCSVYAMPFILMKRIVFVNGFLRSAPPNWSWKHKDWLRCKISFPFSDVIVSNSNAGLKVYKVPPDKALCIYNGFDFDRVTSLEDENSIRSRFGIQTKYVIGMVASFSDKKDFESFIHCGLSILKNRTDVTFIAVGDGENRSFCENLIPEKYKGNFVFTGKVLDTESIIRVFDIGVLLSNISLHGEGISNSIMEYMALGKPVIASDSGGNTELVQNNITGFIVPDNDPEKIVPLFNKLIDDDPLSHLYGNSGLERIKAEFQFSVLVKRYKSMYSEIMQRCLK